MNAATHIHPHLCRAGSLPKAKVMPGDFLSSGQGGIGVGVRVRVGNQGNMPILLS